MRYDYDSSLQLTQCRKANFSIIFSRILYGDSHTGENTWCNREIDTMLRKIRPPLILLPLKLHLLKCSYKLLLHQWAGPTMLGNFLALEA